MNKLSVIIPTLNEEETIKRSIASVVQISEDIVVVDSGSSDETVKIVKELGARIDTRTFDNFAQQRNYADSKTQNNWVLSMDADEEIPPDLQKEILKVLNAPRADAYLIPRRNIIFGKEIKHTRWSPDAHVWLYDKTKGSWQGEVHEEFVSTGVVHKLVSGKIHYSHKNIRDFLEMLNRYTEMEAQEVLNAGQAFSFYKMFYFPTRSFIGRFFVKQGYLDGYHGFVLSVLRAFYQFVKWAKVWEKQNHD